MHRLKWRKESGRFAAYPLGAHQHDIIAIVTPPVHVNASWGWRIEWPGWFLVQGYGADKQAAADAATEQWWSSVAAEVPRDIETEVLLIAARVVVRPPPNSLYAEDSEFLTRLMNTLRLQFADELSREELPRPVKEMMANISEQLFRRRTGGANYELKPLSTSHPRPGRRR